MELVTIIVAASVASWGNPIGSRWSTHWSAPDWWPAGASALESVDRTQDATPACRGPRIARCRLVAFHGKRSYLVRHDHDRGWAWRLLAATVNLGDGRAGAGDVGAYVCAYTPLKSRTSHNTAVGAVAGGDAGVDGLDGRRRTFEPGRGDAVHDRVLVAVPTFHGHRLDVPRRLCRRRCQMLSVVDPTGRRVGWWPWSGAGVIAGQRCCRPWCGRGNGLFFGALLGLG